MNKVVKPIKIFVGLKANDNILVTIFIGVTIIVIAAVVIYEIFKMTGVQLHP